MVSLFRGGAGVDVYWRGPLESRGFCGETGPDLACGKVEAEGNVTTRWLKVMLLSMTTAMAAQVSVVKADFGKTHDGQTVEIYTLKSDVLEARIITFGARVVS